MSDRNIDREKIPKNSVMIEETQSVSLSTSDFERFLVKRLQLDPEESLQSSDWAGTGNTIGALALRLGVLDLDQIDRILDMQEEDKRRFGEIAVNLEFMTERQVQRLIQLQRYHQLLEAGEILVLRGLVTVEDLQQSLVEFYRQNDAVTAPTPEAVEAI